MASMNFARFQATTQQAFHNQHARGLQHSIPSLPAGNPSSLASLPAMHIPGIQASQSGNQFRIPSLPATTPYLIPTDTSLLQHVGGDLQGLPSSYLNLPITDPEATEHETDDFEESTDEHSFQDYVPAYFSDGLPHPDPLVQSACMSAVLPPQIHYRISIPRKVFVTPSHVLFPVASLTVILLHTGN